MTGFELSRLRKRFGLTAEQAAAQVRVTARSWRRWESGERRVPEGSVKLFKLLNKVRNE